MTLRDAQKGNVIDGLMFLVVHEDEPSDVEPSAPKVMPTKH